MHWVVREALAVLKKYDLMDTPVGCRQLEDICDGEDIHLTYFPFKGRIQERYIRFHDGVTILTLDARLQGDELAVKRLMAHGLGHHFLHHGNHCYLHSLWLDKQERQAEMFAAMLLVPPGVIRLQRSCTPRQLEKAFTIPRELATMRYRMLEHRKM